MNKNITILYVEDDKIIRENTTRPLNYLCNTLYVANDGIEGLELYKQYLPDIVVSDIKMPNLNGIEMAKAIKQITPKQHIIFTTAHSESEYFIDAIDMQVDGYILKPIDYDLLENKIEDIIKQINLKLEHKLQQERIHKQELTILEQSKNAQMGEMISNIAHQWRQPLSMISTSATGMIVEKRLGELTDDKLIENCNIINKYAQYLSKTIDTFRNYIKEDKILKKVILQNRIKMAIDIIKPVIDDNNIEFLHNLDEVEPIEIELVLGELSQVIINIINNAKDVLIQKNIENKMIKLTLSKKEDKAIITIQDNAGGIAEDIIDRIFEPYFTTKYKAQGTGLGLYMSKNMIEKSLKGSLSVKNTQDGAMFIIQLNLKTKH